MPATLVLPWKRTGEPAPERVLVFASRFDAAGPRRGWQVLIGGVRLRRAVLRAPGALAVSLRADPVRGHYYTLSLWRDQDSLLTFARGAAHQRGVRRMAELGPVRGVLVSWEGDPRQLPAWRDTAPWLSALDPGPYRHQHRPGLAGAGPGAPLA